MASYKEGLSQLVEISQFAGGRVDYTQGGGGNTSVKLDGEIMAIKASGYKLSDITETEAYVTVDYQQVKDYYENVDINQDKDFEKESAEIAKNSVRLLDGMKPLRPSVEVGFHAVLKKYVIHIHSAYVSIVVCSKDGQKLMEKLLAGKDYGFVFVPYINPGFTLTLAINDKIKRYTAQSGKAPEAIFMVNHGLVVHADQKDRAKAIVEEINDIIMRHYNIAAAEFDSIELQETGDNKFQSKTKAVKDFADKYGFNAALLDEYPLYPDQLVYLNNCTRLTPEKMEIDGANIVYNTSRKEAVTLEETLAAFLFSLGKLKDFNLPISTMSEKDVSFINNWEAEKFRRSLSK